MAERTRFAGVFARLQPYRLWIQSAFLFVWLGPFGLRYHGVCAPVFHCYACPLATFACPIGVLANFSALHLIPFMTIGLLVLFGLFSEVVNRAPYMIVGNPNYVKKVVFPLEVFVLSGLGSALINMLIGYGAWLIGWVLIERCLPPWTIVWMPVVLLPVCLTTAGVSWALASIGVFVRDVGHAVSLATQVLFFATPIFYSLQRVPQPWRRVLEVNPLTHAIEDLRRIMMWKGGGPAPQPEWAWWIAITAVSAVLALLGYAFFMKSKRAFADVI